MRKVSALPINHHTYDESVNIIPEHNIHCDNISITPEHHTYDTLKPILMSISIIPDEYQHYPYTYYKSVIIGPENRTHVESVVINPDHHICYKSVRIIPDVHAK